MSKPGILNLFKHMAQLINKDRVRGPPTAQLLRCDNCCTCTEQKYKQLLITQRSLQSMRRPWLFLVGKQSHNGGTAGKLFPLKFSKRYLVVRYNINLQWFFSPLKYHQLVAAMRPC